MIIKILRIVGTGILLLTFAIPVRHFINRNTINNQLKRQEMDTIGSIDVFNPRVNDIQKILQDSKHYNGPVNGKMNAKTRLALRSFQSEKDLAVTGIVNSKTLSELNKQEYALLKADHQKFVSQLPKTAKPLIKPDIKKSDEKSSHRKMISFKVKPSQSVHEVQLALKKSGFYKGNVDGKSGIQTQKAIKDFQVSMNLQADGVVGQKTWDKLKKF